MKTSNAGKALIMRYEGCRLTAYKPVKAEKYYTIGYGHYGADVYEGMKITQAEADNLLVNDLAKYEGYVTVTGLTLTQNQFDALVSFTYNCGAGNLQKLVKGRDYQQIADAMLLYNKGADKKVLAGLQRRRKEERELFLSGGTPAAQTTKAATKTTRDLAQEVIDGKWGNGSERKRRLTEAGYSYTAVQAEVNKMLKRR